MTIPELVAAADQTGHGTQLRAALTLAHQIGHRFTTGGHPLDGQAWTVAWLMVLAADTHDPTDRGLLESAARILAGGLRQTIHTQGTTARN